MRLPIVSALTPLQVNDGASFNTFTTFQDVSPTPQLVIPQQNMDAGCEILLRAHGEFSTTGTPNFQLGFWFNGAAGAAPTSILAEMVATATGSNAASWPWEAWWWGRLRPPLGSSAVFKGMGGVNLGTSLTAYAAPIPMPTTAAARAVTVDTTANRAVGVGAAWGTSNASNNVICYNLSAWII